MTSSTSTKAIPTPAILVFGKPTSPDAPQASWFRLEDRTAVVAAAQSLKFSVLEILTDAEKAVLAGVHEGVLKGNGRMIVGSVTPEVYKSIEDYAASSSTGSTDSKASVAQSASVISTSEQNVNISADKEAGSGPAGPAQAWEKLKPGDRVLAAYFNLEKEAEGWWPATVARVEKTQIVLNWPDAPHYPAIKRPPKHVAILHPDFLASGK